MDLESQHMIWEKGITTVSFFSGDKPNLTSRLLEIVKANPWLVSTLIRNKKIHEKNIILCYPSGITEEHIKTVYHESTLPISENMPFEELSKALSKKAILPMGTTLLKKKLPISSFTLTPCTNNNEGGEGKFALIVSISHAVADGHTYYKILSMLSSSTQIESLNAKRKFDVAPKIRAATGEAEYNYGVSSATMINCVLKMANPFSAKTEIAAYYIDKEKVKNTKAKEDEREKKKEKQDLEMPFSCSTNDILTSSFGNAAEIRVLMMAINLRKRLEGAVDNDAGNYESVVMYDPPGYEHPSDIRKSLCRGVPFIREHSHPLPKFCEASRCRIGIITSWAFSSFDGEIVLGGSNTKMTLHLPVFDAKAIPFPIAVVFKPKKDSLAIIYAGPQHTVCADKLNAAGAPIGDIVNSSIFVKK